MSLGSEVLLKIKESVSSSKGVMTRQKCICCMIANRDTIGFWMQGSLLNLK